MLRPLTLSIAVTLLLSACGGTVSGSRYNPVNWFGKNVEDRIASGEPLVPAEAMVAPLDVRVPVEVTRVEVARTDSGALVTATGVAPAPGYYNAQLARVGIDGGILVLRLVAEAPPAPVPGGRTITAAAAISSETLAGLSGVRVEGAGGALSAGF